MFVKQFFSAALSTALVLSTMSIACAQNVAQHLQDISVTIKSGFSEGSGVLITREIVSKDGSDKKININFVITCAHVVDNLRSTRQIIVDGKPKTIVEFKDAQIVKELVENGRKVGELKMDAKVILYSHAENGEDLAILMVRKRGFVSANTEFYLEEKTVDIGTNLFHVGSLLGQSGANSMTAGIMSQVGRVLNLGAGAGTVFDQTTVTAFPGSSGGGVFLTNGKYVGMLVRGAGETFNLIVPVRRMKTWVKSRGIEWVLDPNAQMPTLEYIKNMEVENESSEHKTDTSKDSESSKAFPHLIRDMRPIKTKEKSE
jgi:S1-C subfamily serine protease